MLCWKASVTAEQVEDKAGGYLVQGLRPVSVLVEEDILEVL